MRLETLSSGPESAGDTQQEAEEEEAPETLYAVLVTIRSFLKFLSSHVVSTSTIACECPRSRYDLIADTSLRRHLPRPLHDSVRLRGGFRRRRRGIDILYTCATRGVSY